MADPRRLTWHAYEDLLNRVAPRMRRVLNNAPLTAEEHQRQRDREDKLFEVPNMVSG